MALPTTGQLTLNQINVELGNSSGSQASLRSMSSTAGFSTPDSVSEFYGFSGGSNIVVDYNNSITYFTNVQADKDGYRGLVMTGRESGDIFTATMEQTYTELGGASGFYTLSYRKNGAASWASLGAGGTPVIVQRSITGIDSNDTVDIRLAVSVGLKDPGTATLKVDLTGGTITTGSGTVTASGTTSWTLSVTGGF